MNTTRLGILLGMPGSGKTTIAHRLSSAGIKVISPGATAGAVSRKASRKGGPPEDGIVESIRSLKAEKVFLDGFPGSVRHLASVLKKMDASGIELSTIVILNISRALAVKRLAGRRVCPGDGRVYNMYFLQPALQGVCDVCGSVLERRGDDSIEAINRRMDLFEEETVPVIERLKDRWARLTYEMSAEKSLDQIVNAILTASSARFEMAVPVSV